MPRFMPRSRVRVSATVLLEFPDQLPVLALSIADLCGLHPTRVPHSQGFCLLRVFQKVGTFHRAAAVSDASVSHSHGRSAPCTLPGTVRITRLASPEERSSSMANATQIGSVIPRAAAAPGPLTLSGV